MPDDDIIFEDALSDDWARDLEVVEVPLSDRPLLYLGWVLVLIGLIVIGRIAFLGTARADLYGARAERNLDRYVLEPAPRGAITDRFGAPLAENTAVFSALLDLREFARHPELQDRTVLAIQDIFGMPADDVWNLIGQSDLEASTEPLVVALDISREQIIAVRGLQLPTLSVSGDFRRTYPDGPVFSSVVGYTGLATRDDLTNRPELTGRSVVGKAGVEAFYEDRLEGTPGATVTRRDARGTVLDVQKQSEPQVGGTLTLTIDAGFQRYFYQALQNRLAVLGRTAGAGLAIDPRNGEVLALTSFPTYDNNIFTTSGRNDERRAVLASPGHPLFNRAAGGLYNPGSIIKPLVGVAALAEGVTDPNRIVFSPGYLDIPNPYDPENPTRYLDWRYQGNVNLAAAIAQSSNVYFYEIGGGAPARPNDFGHSGGEGRAGLGISKLAAWWDTFKLGTLTGIDLPGEAKGLLPTPDWKQRTTGRPWLLGDTYNAAIGQGDLLVTPLQLLDYIGAIANGGTVYRPVLNKDAPHGTLADLTSLAPEIREVQKGMLEAVRAPLGTAHSLADLPVSVAAKTGSAQVQNNTQENAFFVGYIPAENPQIAILVLIENSKEGSLNAVPVAKDVLNWYYWNRIAKGGK